MKTLNTLGRIIQLDGNGYFVHASDWEPPIAVSYARKLGLELDVPHIEVIEFLRCFYVSKHRSPHVREVCTGCKLTLTTLYKLFPAGLSLACKIAGLPQPACSNG